MTDGSSQANPSRRLGSQPETPSERPQAPDIVKVKGGELASDPKVGVIRANLKKGNS